jgi:hypothetical protein
MYFFILYTINCVLCEFQIKTFSFNYAVQNFRFNLRTFWSISILPLFLTLPLLYPIPRPKDFENQHIYNLEEFLMSLFLIIEIF